MKAKILWYKMNIILHIGIQRTGTTFLQYNIFPNIKEINIVNFYRYDGILHDVLPMAEISKLLGDVESFSNKFIRKEINNFSKNDKINLFTNENIYCQMFERGDRRYEKIKKIFPNAKIIFGTRNKDDLLLSWYKKYVVNGGTLSFLNFKKEHINMEKINYESYVHVL